MKHLNASGFSRLVAYFIDFFILTTISDLILKIVYPLVGYDPNLLVTKYNLFMEQIGSSLEISQELLYQVLVLALIQLGLSFAVMLPLVIIYFCIIGYYWNRQTVGRLLMGLKLVNEDESKVSFPRLLLREVIGNYFITYVLATSSFIPMIFLIYLAVTKGKVFADYIGKTRLINLRFAYVDEKQFGDFKEHIKKEFFDAEFRDIYSETQKEEEKTVKQEDFDSDDEYRII